MKVSGNIVLATAARFQEALEGAVAATEQAEDPASRVLVVDLSDTEFMDSVGVTTLMASTRGLRQRGGEVRLAIPPGERVKRILEVTGLVALFRVYPDVLSAAEDRPGGA